MLKIRNSLDTLFRSTEDVYSAVKGDIPGKSDAELLLGLRAWFIRVCDFDPMTGQSLPQDLCEVLRKVRHSVSDQSSNPPKDRLSRVLDHSKDALFSIIANPREKVLREHAILPIFAAREFDSACVQWLSRQPGRNLREKLVGKPYIKAINRRMCFDTSENRLFKAFITKLEQLLLAKELAFVDHPEASEDESLALLQRWLRDDASCEIGSWTNLPPNNTLLQNKNYRKIWDSWLCLQSLDQNIKIDHGRLKEDFLTALFWSAVASFEESGKLRLVQQPCLFDYDHFNIDVLFGLGGKYYPHQVDEDTKLFQICFVGKSNLQIFVGEKSVSITVIQDGSVEVVFSNKEKAKKSKKLECLLPSLVEIVKRAENFLFGTSFKANVVAAKLEATEKNNEIVLDLCSTRPCFVDTSGTEKILPYRLVRQYWPSADNGDLYIDCGRATAINLSPEITTVSILNLFSGERGFSAALMSSAAVGFSQSLYNYFKTEKLIYLVPDSINEFALDNLRRSVNFYFPDSAPLPRSIASVFAWQSSENVEKPDFNHRDILIVIDRSVDGFSLTPLRGYPSNELSESVPASKGLCWERHPTIILKGFDPINEAVQSALQEDDCVFSKEITSLFDIEEILNGSAPLSWVDHNQNWYDISKNAVDEISQLTSNVKLPWDDIQREIENLLGKDLESVYVLSTDERVEQPPKEKSFRWLGFVRSLVEGGQTLSRWQSEAGDIPFWKDHLPNLSFKIPIGGRWGQFDVVKDATVTPQKGKCFQIPIEEPFTLGAGKSHFSFQLLQGAGGQALRYMAYLKSPAFPLSSDTVCNLRMIYTYGADDPYQLEFIPRNTNAAGFKSVHVEWRELDKVNTLDLSYPRFPQRYTWDYYERFPKRDSAEFSNLLEWVVETLDRLPQYRDSINKGIYSSKQLRARIRFPVLTIWNQDHSLSDADAPDWFRNSIQNGISAALSMFGSKNVTKEMKTEILFFLSGLHKDAPDVVPGWLMATFKNLDLLEIFHKHIAIAIGDCNLDWQKSLLKKSIFLMDSDDREMSTLGLQILSFAFWRSENLIYRLTAQELKTILECTLSSLEDSFNDFQTKLKNHEFYVPFEIVKLELILALVRTRSFDDEDVKRLLLPQNIISERLVKIVDEFVQEICRQDIAFRSFVRLQVDKPQAFYKTPDLLYALRMYLTGDSGANAIQVTGVNYQD